MFTSIGWKSFAGVERTIDTTQDITLDVLARFEETDGSAWEFIADLLEVTIENKPIRFLLAKKQLKQGQRLLVMKGNLEVIGHHDQLPVMGVVFVFFGHGKRIR